MINSDSICYCPLNKTESLMIINFHIDLIIANKTLILNLHHTENFIQSTWFNQMIVKTKSKNWQLDFITESTSLILLSLNYSHQMN